MDARLLAWGRAVKARHRPAHPVLWLFTDSARMPDPLAAIARLPKGLAGVVFRHDGIDGRDKLARQVARLCRSRGLALTISGDWRLAAALRCGLHLRAGSGRQNRTARLWTSSAHSLPELRRAVMRGALPVLSPVFPTPSHPDAAGIGPVRWAGLARKHRALALGGVPRRGRYRRAGLTQGCRSATGLVTSLPLQRLSAAHRRQI
jgi:thiamine-phosphate pyrophosphorylase